MASLARNEPTVRVRPDKVAPPHDRVPDDLVRQYLANEAVRRERVAVHVMIALGSVGIAIMLVATAFDPQPDFVIAGLAIQGTVVVYAGIMLLRMRRGWYHASLPFVNAIVESLTFAAMYSAGILLIDHRVADVFAAMPLWGAYVVFTAVRADARIPLLAGSVAAAEIFVVLFVFDVTPVVNRPVMIARAAFFLFAGVLGAALARYLVSHSRETLRAIREQDLFGKYILGERLGRGGMGEVYRATYCPEGGFVRTVAVKQVLPDLSADPTFDRMFREEARLCAGLVHPNLVQVHDCGKFRGRFVLAMEYVDGVSLRALLARRAVPLDLAAITYLGAELATALDYLHGAPGPDGEPGGLVHWDLNPPNVLISRRGDVKLGDFGVARVVAPGITRFAGKEGYAAPEQLAGVMDARSDLYALGVTLHEALTGQAPPPDGALSPPSQTRRDVSPQLDKLIMSLIEPNLDLRPRDAARVRTTLLGFEGDLAPYPRGKALLAAAVELAGGDAPRDQAPTVASTTSTQRD